MIRRHVTPALIVFIILLAGCLSRPLLGRLWWLPLLPGLAAAAAVIALAGARAARARTRILAVSTAVGLILASVFLARMWLASSSAFLPVPERDVSEFRGRVIQDSSLSMAGDSVTRLALLDASSSRRGIGGRARGSVLLFIEGDSRFALGETMSVYAGLSRSETGGPDAFIAWARPSEIRRRGFDGPLWAFRAAGREWLHAAVAAAGYPASTLLDALLIGSREDVPQDLSDGFLRTGSLHILALSGLHVSVLYGIVAGMLWFLRWPWLRFLLATVVLLFYQLLAGFMPSLLRATTMIVIGGIALGLDRDQEPLNILALSGIVLLLIDPFQAFTLSFQLSFLALAGILAFGPLVQWPLESRLPRFLLTAFAMSVGAQAATLPLVIARFGVYYPSGLFASLVLVPLTTAYLWAGLAWLPLSAVPWPALHDLCAGAFALFYRVIERSASYMARLPGVSFDEGCAPWIALAAGVVVAATVIVFPLRRGATNPPLRVGGGAVKGA